MHDEKCPECGVGRMELHKRECSDYDLSLAPECRRFLPPEPSDVHKTTEWRCFHCDAIFTNRKHAAEHFGAHEGGVPACKLSHSEGHLVTYIRKLQAELNAYREERDEVLLAWHARDAEHAAALRREEEKGFARGVSDMKAHGYRLR